MFERFTEEGRGILARSTELATEFHSPWVRRHHMLVALLDAPDDVTAAVFDEASVDRAQLRSKLVASLTASETATDDPDGRTPFSSGAKKALELSLREALSLGHRYIAGFHLLLAILRSADGPLAEVIEPVGLDYDQARARARVRALAPEGERGRGRRYGRGGRRRATAGLEAVMARVDERVGRDRKATTGDLLVALVETPGTHFATIVGTAMPDANHVAAEADRLLAEQTADGDADASFRVDPKTGAVTVDDPKIADALRKLAESGRLGEILDKLSD